MEGVVKSLKGGEEIHSIRWPRGRERGESYSRREGGGNKKKAAASHRNMAGWGKEKPRLLREMRTERDLFEKDL